MACKADLLSERVTSAMGPPSETVDANIKRAREANSLLVKIVVFNLLLYLLIAQLVSMDALHHGIQYILHLCCFCLSHFR